MALCGHPGDKKGHYLYTGYCLGNQNPLYDSSWPASQGAIQSAGDAAVCKHSAITT